jgi:hypothetical protein
MSNMTAPDRGDPVFAVYRFRQLPVIFVPVGSTPNLSYFIGAAHTAIRQLDSGPSDADALLSKLATFATTWGLRVHRTSRTDAVELEVRRLSESDRIPAT